MFLPKLVRIFHDKPNVRGEREFVMKLLLWTNKAFKVLISELQRPSAPSLNEVMGGSEAGQ